MFKYSFIATISAEKNNLKFNCKCKVYHFFVVNGPGFSYNCRFTMTKLGWFFLYRSTGSFNLNILSGIINFPIHEHCALLSLDDDYTANVSPIKSVGNPVLHGVPRIMHINLTGNTGYVKSPQTLHLHESYW